MDVECCTVECIVYMYMYNVYNVENLSVKSSAELRGKEALQQQVTGCHDGAADGRDEAAELRVQRGRG